MIDDILNPLISRYVHRDMTQDALYDYMRFLEDTAEPVDEDDLTPDFGESFTENHSLLRYNNRFWLLPTMPLFCMLARNLNWYLKEKATAPETIKERALLKSLHLDVLETVFSYEFMRFTKNTNVLTAPMVLEPSVEELEQNFLCRSRASLPTKTQALNTSPYNQAYKCQYGDHWHAGRTTSNLHSIVRRRKLLNAWNRVSKTQ